jgi:hypothetical protein
VTRVQTTRTRRLRLRADQRVQSHEEGLSGLVRRCELLCEGGVGYCASS